MASRESSRVPPSGQQIAGSAQRGSHVATEEQHDCAQRAHMDGDVEDEALIRDTQKIRKQYQMP
jgi:hypothetical protein